MLQTKNLAFNPEICPITYAKKKGVFELIILFRFNFSNQVRSFKGEYLPNGYLAFSLKLISNKARVSNIARLIFEQETILL